MLESIIKEMRAQLQASQARRILIACSGGRDSMVLSHMVIHHIRPSFANILLLHINHGLDNQAGERAKHSYDYAKRHSLPVCVLAVNIAPSSHGPEASARKVRYQAWQLLAKAGDWFCCA